MFVHNKKLQYTVRVDEPNPAFAKLCLEQFGGPNGELAAAMRYFTQGWGESDVARRDMLLDIATEELSHLEMIGQIISGLLKGAKSAGAMIDEVEGSYLGELMDGKHEDYMQLAWNSTVPTLTGGSGLRLVDSMGAPWTSAYIDTIGHPLADLRSDIAAEARAKVVYDRLIKLCPDTGAEDALRFLMTREVAHQKMFESALAAIANNFPSSNVPPDERFTHAYFDESQNGKRGKSPGFDMVNSQGLWNFELSEPHAGGEEPDLPDPKPSVMSTEGSKNPKPTINTTSRTTQDEIEGSPPRSSRRSSK
ncbi:MAG TPA: manganese catalase family protein [Candidatus Baltobacteraceae bacterium]|jgi:Mn-containing catalase|nr:manganese catalase family protein [Candidatus Baltobacteraceae bacterium]